MSERDLKTLYFLHFGFEIPHWVTQLLNAAGHLSIINVIVNRLSGQMQQPS